MNKKISHYIRESKKEMLNFEKEIKIAFLSSFTINGLAETIKAKCIEKKIGCNIYTGNYNQYNQEILDKKSKLYDFKPDLTYLIIDTRSIFTDLFFHPFSMSVNERKDLVKNKFNEIVDLQIIFSKNSSSKLIVSNLAIPYYSPYGINDNKHEYGLVEMINDFNSQLTNYYKKIDSVFIYDFNRFNLEFGSQHIFDYRQYFYGDIKISLDSIPSFADDLIQYVFPIKSSNRKCIVVDLDNTLWGGIVGEDGLDGIKLGPTYPGNTFVEFQHLLLALHERGIILAINSKNNFNDALEAIREHPYMVLREKYFASFRINWSDKISNMKEISNELNIGLDSMIFLDDDPFNRELMQKVLPQVLTVDLPKDPALYANSIININELNTLKIVKEDLQKGKMYFEQRKRNESKTTFNDLDNYLKDLKIKIMMKHADEFSMPRISQLVLKTNQFNLTTKRYQKEELSKLVKDDNVIIGCCQVEDKFGDNGITNVFIIKTTRSEWIIDLFLSSCRVMGRGIEKSILEGIVDDAKKAGIQKIMGKFIPTKRNIVCENFYEDCGFTKENNYWKRDINEKINIPEHIELKKDYD